MLDRLTAARCPAESYGDVILRLAKGAAARALLHLARMSAERGG
jgi:hypothetical protein